MTRRVHVLRYWLIGQGTKTTGPHKLVKGQVVKMGALSLEVTDTCSQARERDLAEEAEAAKKCVRNGAGLVAWLADSACVRLPLLRYA